MHIVVWVGVLVGGLFAVVVKYFIIVYSSSIVGFLVGNALIGAVVDCTVDSVLSLFFIKHIIFTIHNSSLFIHKFSFFTLFYLFLFLHIMSLPQFYF